MTMNFETLEDSVTALLTAAEDIGAGRRYVTIGYEERTQSGEEVLNLDRTVQVFYDAGEFSKQGGSMRGPVPHDMTFKVVITASSATSVDISVLNNPASSAGDVITALAAKDYAVKRASKSWNEVTGIIWNILMDATNKDLGLAAHTVASRWCERFVKDSPLKYGNVVVFSGGIVMTCRINEEITGDTDSEPIDTVNTTVSFAENENDDPIDGPEVTNDDYDD